MIQNTLHSQSVGRGPIPTGTLRVEMIADLVCPWCFLGKRRLDRALSAVLGPTQFNWLPFQLNPNMPADGMGFDEYVASKFGDRRAIEPGLERLRQAGAEEGITFRFERMKRVPNTLDAHRLMSMAGARGANTAGVAEGLLSSFFEDGLDIGDREVLIQVGGELGLDRHHVVRGFDDEPLRHRVLQEEAEIRRGGVSGVPNFLVNSRLMVLGAQPTEVLVDAFDRAMFGDESDLPVSDSVH